MDVLANAASLASSSSVSETSSHDVIAQPNSAIPKKSRKAPKLQHILMELLNNETVPDAIWWLPGEKEFAINSELFPSKVLEVHFPGSKYASFIRRLHKLGFSRQTRSLKKVYGSLPAHAVAFRHDKFRRDRPDLLDQLKNGYWKEAKARKQQEEQQRRDSASVASSTGSSTAEGSASPPTSILTDQAQPPVSALSLPQVISSAPTTRDPPVLREEQVESVKPMTIMSQTATKPEGTSREQILLYLEQIEEEQRRIHEREQELIMLIAQRKQKQQQEQEQLEMEHQVALQRQMMLQQQQPSSLYTQAEESDLRRYQFLQFLQKQQQQEGNPHMPSSLFASRATS